jgi:hypothetical protein
MKASVTMSVTIKTMRKPSTKPASANAIGIRKRTMSTNSVPKVIPRSIEGAQSRYSVETPIYRRRSTSPSYRTQTPFTSFIPVAHRTAWRRAAVRTQTPLTRCIPAPQASRTVVTMLSGCWTATSGIAYADDPIATAKAIATSLIMISSSKFRAHCNVQRRQLQSTVRLIVSWTLGQQVNAARNGWPYPAQTDRCQ